MLALDFFLLLQQNVETEAWVKKGFEQKPKPPQESEVGPQRGPCILIIPLRLNFSEFIYLFLMEPFFNLV